MALSLSSSAFKEGETIPKEFSCEGADKSPELKWSEVPAGTKSFVMIMDDPDAPVGTWDHWVLFDIAADKDRTSGRNLQRSRTQRRLPQRSQ